MRNKNFGKAVIIFTMASVLLAGCGKKEPSDVTEASTFETEQSVEQTSNETTQETETESETQNETTTIIKPETETVINDFAQKTEKTSLVPAGETVRSFLTGEWINDTVGYRRPIAVMINNIQGGLPQRGISKADVIFEGQCEGSITRLMAVFQSYDEIDSIGSIRSCRDYFPFLAAEYDAAYFHFGQSDFALEFLPDPELRTFNGMTGMYNYERRTDRVSPHNVFTTPANLLQAMVNKGVSTYLDDDFVQPLKFVEVGEEISYDDMVCKTLKTGYAYNDAYFVYNEEDGLYYRYEYGNPQIDEMTGEQIAVKNIIMKLVPGQEYWNHSPLYLLTGSGLGLYVTNGTAKWIKWEKDVDGVNTNLGCEYTYGYGPTKYKYFETNDDVYFNCGKTWICIYEQEDQPLIQILDK